jgi:hypothetical protein
MTRLSHNMGSAVYRNAEISSHRLMRRDALIPASQHNSPKLLRMRYVLRGTGIFGARRAATGEYAGSLQASIIGSGRQMPYRRAPDDPVVRHLSRIPGIAGVAAGIA